jgi:hypothetical protein
MEFLTTHVNNHPEQDWNKLVKVMPNLLRTVNNRQCYEAGNVLCFKKCLMFHVAYRRILCSNEPHWSHHDGGQSCDALSVFKAEITTRSSMELELLSIIDGSLRIICPSHRRTGFVVVTKTPSLEVNANQTLLNLPGRRPIEPTTIQKDPSFRPE